MTNTEMRTELLERATRLEEAAKRCRQAAAILTTPDEPTNGTAYNKGVWNDGGARDTNGKGTAQALVSPPIRFNAFLPVAEKQTHPNGNGHHKTKPSPRRDRAVRALKKHGPLAPSTLGAYVGVPRVQVSAYAAPWIKSGHVRYNEKAYRYELGPAAK